MLPSNIVVCADLAMDLFVSLDSMYEAIQVIPGTPSGKKFIGGPHGSFHSVRYKDRSKGCKIATSKDKKTFLPFLSGDLFWKGTSIHTKISLKKMTIIGLVSYDDIEDAFRTVCDAVSSFIGASLSVDGIKTSNSVFSHNIGRQIIFSEYALRERPEGLHVEYHDWIHSSMKIIIFHPDPRTKHTFSVRGTGSITQFSPSDMKTSEEAYEKMLKFLG